MPSQVLSSIENNFTKGLITEFTGLNFPENAATDCDNTVFTIVGDTTRRLGVDYEANFVTNNHSLQSTTCKAYKWNNAGGDGQTQIVVQQAGSNLFFYKSSNATDSLPLSSTLMSSVISLLSFSAFGSSVNPNTSECQFSQGNGYLFVFHPDCDPFYLTYSNSLITGTRIDINIRDFAGVPEPTLPISTRPATLSTEHTYNLTNQGWTAGNSYSLPSATSQVVSTGSKLFTVPAAVAGVTNGDQVQVYYTGFITPGVPAGIAIMSGTVTGYSTTNLTLNITSIYNQSIGFTVSSWLIVPINRGYLATWFTAIGNYPSNADVWWYFKNNSNVFDPATTVANTSLSSGNAPQGHYILNAFSQQRDTASNLAITDIQTFKRPRTGCWFQGRVFYGGTDDSAPANGDAPFYTWTENIYFSQTCVNSTDFGLCYQTNDPTSETLFDLLPTDGGVITIQGTGAIYKLFPIQNGMLVHAQNGIWFITGSQGIGFAANDYTITKISNVQCISGSSFIDVLGLPYFWNEEGIYAVKPSKNGSLEVDPITVSTILQFYGAIPTVSKRYVQGDYDPINYVIQWAYRSTPETGLTNRYEYDRVLNFNTFNQAFYPYTVGSNDTNSICGLLYVNYPGSATNPEAAIKYMASAAGSSTWAEEYNTDYLDWGSSGSPVDYNSFFITGFKLHGQGQRRFQLPYIYVFSKTEGPTSYKIQGIWDYASSPNTGKWSVNQLVNINKPGYGMVFRRHRIRGQGLVLQLRVSSVEGQPYDIMGWSSFETQNTGV